MAEWKLEITRQENNIRSCIVFIHGFQGSEGTTWGSFPSFLEMMPELQAWDILSFGYSSSLSPDLKGIWSGDPDIKMIAASLSSFCRSQSIAIYDKIVFVAHSMGGLALQRALLDDQELSSRTEAVVLFGTPSFGLKKASILNVPILRRIKGQVADMARGGDFIRQLRADWNYRFSNSDKLPFRFLAVAGTEDQFVDQEASITGFPKDQTDVVPGNHLSIVKPNSKKDASVDLLLRVIREVSGHDQKYNISTSPKPIVCDDVEENRAQQQSSISCDSQDDFMPKLLNSLVLAIKDADLEDLSAALANYLSPKPLTDSDDLINDVADRLLAMGFHDAVPGPIYKTCEYFLSTDPLIQEKRSDRLTPAEEQRFTQVISKVMGLLALYALDETVFQDQDRLQRVDDSYFIAQGISTELGVELLLKRVGSPSFIVPDIQSGQRGTVELKGQAVIQKRSKDKWAKNSNVDHALIDIWNAVEDHEDPEGRFPRRNRNEKLDESSGEVEELNEKIAFYRKHPSSPRCFFIAERLDNAERMQELCSDLSKKLPALTAVGFKSQDGATVFLQGDIGIKVAIESIYKTFGFCK